MGQHPVGDLLRGSSHTLPPLVAVIVTLAVFGIVIGFLALEVGLSPEVIEQSVSVCLGEE